MPTRAARLDIRITPSVKSVIENAANFLGVTTSAFVLKCVLEKATQVMQQAQLITLNAEESQRFLEMLENPPEPNEKLKRLLVTHRKRKKKKVE